MRKFLSVIIVALTIFALIACDSTKDDSQNKIIDRLVELELQIKQLRYDFDELILEADNSDITDGLNALRKKLGEIEQEISDLSQSDDSKETLDKLLDELKAINDKLESTESNVEKIYLTSQNYSEYLTISLTFSDFYAEYTGNDIMNLRNYNCYCVAHLTTSRKANCYFNDAFIGYTVNIEYWQSQLVIPTSTISYDGNSETTFLVWRKDVPEPNIDSLPSSYSAEISVNYIIGTVSSPTTLI